MKVLLRHPTREVEMNGPLRADVLLQRLDIHRDTVLVIVDGTLISVDTLIPDTALVEIRSVISGGAQ